MNILLDPNVAYLLIVSGFTFAILALFSPGTGLIELGALFSLLLAGYSIYNLPINAWALVVLLLGVFPFLLALRRSRQWIFLLVSIIAMVAGSAFLFRSETWQPAVNPFLALVVSILVAGFMWLVGRKGLEAIARPTFDPGWVVGMTGEARTPISKEGSVYVNNEQWSARSRIFIPAGTVVRVVSRQGFTLIVEPVYPPEESKTD